MTQPRANSGRFGKAEPEVALTEASPLGELPGTPEPAIPTPMLDRLADLQARRAASPGHFIIEPPVPLSELNTIGMVRTGEGIVPSKVELSSGQLKEHLYRWLQRIAAEGLPWDLEHAWFSWKPHPLVKVAHRTEYDRVLPPCRLKMSERAVGEERERMALQAVEQRRQRIVAARKEVEEAEKQLAVEVPAELEKRRARLAELEAA